MELDLFQGVLLGLLALGVVVLTALLATLGGVRKSLDDLRTQGLAQPSGSGQPHSQTISSSYQESSEPAAVATTQAPAAQTQAAQVPAATTASAGGGEADTIRSVLQTHGLSSQSQTQEAADSGVDSAFAAHADDPQEEPFQRDGRWWFKRGDELLLYDEPSGQWQPAPAESSPSTQPVAATGSTSVAATASTTAAPPTTTAPVPAVGEQAATFWKCPTCGAVNGSTAATCRMCFANRP